MSKQSENLKAYLNKKGIRNKDIAEILGVKAPTASNILSGRDTIGLPRCKKLGEALGFDPVIFYADGEIVEIQEGKRIITHAENSTITQGDNSPINIVADNAALEAENKRLRQEVEWLRSMLENREK